MLDRIELVALRRQVDTSAEADPGAATRRELEQSGLLARLPRGARVAVAVGSRHIAGHVEVIGAVVAAARDLGLEPFLVAAMGSHGGGTAEGQRAVLAGHGIAEEAFGCRLLTGMATVSLGVTDDGIPVETDAAAAAADAIVVIGRIKPHTAFSGSLGSGPLKMLAIGLGKQRGAEAVHRAALDGRGLEAAIRSVGRRLLARLPVAGAVGLVENGAGGLARVSAIPAQALESEEPRLLELAAALRPGLGFARLDVLIVDRMGKDISGTGMDPWVIGRRMATGEPEPDTPRITRIYLRSLTPESHGNGHGVGLADFVHRRLAEAIDWSVTRTNAIAAGAPQKSRLPLVFERDDEAIAAALATAGVRDPESARVARIRDTRGLETMAISPALVEEARGLPGVTVAAPARRLEFDADGSLRSF